ncbi:MAG: hypothetical protein ACLRWQ_18760 [Flavonifractor plautii]
MLEAAFQGRRAFLDELVMQEVLPSLLVRCRPADGDFLHLRPRHRWKLQA